MSDLETAVAGHYAPGGLLASIKVALVEAGADPEAPDAEVLKPVDEFHTGGLEATEALLDPLGITPETRVADMGSGIGGTARFIAKRYGAHVTGVDLTPEFVETAEALSQMVGLSDRTAFQTGSVLDLPLASDTYDLATQLHVGMNIADKKALFAEVYRVLKPGGRYAIFDIMTGGSGAEIGFPVPWATDADGSFVESPTVYRAAAEAAGFTPVAERDRTDYALGFFNRVIKAMEEQGPQPIGLHLLMGQTAQEKYGNAVKAAFDGATAPWEMVFEKPS